MDITLERLKLVDAEKLYKFELENRDYFEKLIPSRGDDYYNFKTFINRYEALLEEQESGLSYFYLIKNESDFILGRMNVVDIDKSINLGYLGYRVGKAYIGKGIAKKALKLLLKMTDELGIRKLSAKTTTNNIASQKVLEKSGFTRIETKDEEFEMNGQRLRFMYYIWRG